MTNFKDLKNKIKGPVFSIVTPFNEKDDSIDYKTLKKYIQKIYDAGGRIFYVMGYNSRFSELSWSEIKTLNEFVTKTVKEIDNESIVIVADPLHCSTAISLKFAEHAKKVGADLISLIFREKYYSNEQVYNHYLKIANSVDIGILIHEMPFTSGYGGHTINWPVKLLDKIVDIENVVAIKEDAKNDKYSKEVISTIKDRVSIIISGGGKRQWLQFEKIGCHSWLNGIGVFEPKLAISFWDAYQKKDFEKMNNIISNIEVPFFKKVVSEYGWHLGIKAAMESRGIMQRYERMPMLAIKDNEYKKIDEIISKLPIDKYI